ncbi:hypothetical protein B0H14DRAFT_3540741 [Mycena olivaceomarginata]|nr:hypothetical protein B0H14DRAFT_3540741 [Mycena olivaceomarginata]
MLPDLERDLISQRTLVLLRLRNKPPDTELRQCSQLLPPVGHSPQKGKTPVKASKKRVHNSTDEEGSPCPFRRRRATTLAKKSSGQGSATRAKEGENWIPSPATFQGYHPQRDPLPSFVHFRLSTTRRTWNPPTRSPTIRLLQEPSAPWSALPKKQERLKQKEWEHKATEAMVDALTTQLHDSAISLIEDVTILSTGPTTLAPHSGPGANYTKQKEDEKFTPIRSVPHPRRRTRWTSRTLSVPNGLVALCSLYRVICKPMGPNCNVKKLNSSATTRCPGPASTACTIRLAESPRFFAPAVDLDTERLIKAGSAALMLSSLAISMDTRELLQDLIAEFNYLMDPLRASRDRRAPHESRKGSTAAPSPPSDENDHEGKGEGTSKSQGSAGGGD